MGIYNNLISVEFTFVGFYAITHIIPNYFSHNDIVQNTLLEYNIILLDTIATDYNVAIYTNITGT